MNLLKNKLYKSILLHLSYIYYNTINLIKLFVEFKIIENGISIRISTECFKESYHHSKWLVIVFFCKLIYIVFIYIVH